MSQTTSDSSVVKTIGGCVIITISIGLAVGLTYSVLSTLLSNQKTLIHIDSSSQEDLFSECSDSSSEEDLFLECKD